ncbi:MAG TPA: hypothetical protein DCL06_02740 [Corynebacterium variabile]|uniref:Uncharacterized protein n=1 Tax=Corynebacterium variabile TaxID=1727 RepID=A0A3B9QTB8_9CORY|nr:hypothetical protein [Corynebacterium variabile]
MGVAFWAMLYWDFLKCLVTSLPQVRRVGLVGMVGIIGPVGELVRDICGMETSPPPLPAGTKKAPTDVCRWGLGSSGC